MHTLDVCPGCGKVTKFVVQHGSWCEHCNKAAFRSRLRQHTKEDEEMYKQLQGIPKDALVEALEAQGFLGDPTPTEIRAKFQSIRERFVK